MRLKLVTVTSLALGTLLLIWVTGFGPESTLGSIQFGTHLIHSLAGQLIVSTFFTCLGGLTTAFIALSIGVPMGVGAAYLPRAQRQVVRTALDATSSIPRYILIVLLFSIYGKSYEVLVLGCAIACVPRIAESMRAHVASQLANGRFTAFYAHGISPSKILWFHFVRTTGMQRMQRDLLSVLSLFVITEASLAYIDPFVYTQFSATWGMMISRQLHAGHLSHPHTWLFLLFLTGFLIIVAFMRSQMDTQDGI